MEEYLLRDLLANESIQAVAILDEDGLPINILPKDTKFGQQIAKIGDLIIGNVSQKMVTVNTEKCTLIAFTLVGKKTLTLVLDKNSNLGVIRQEVKNCAQKLNIIFDKE